MNYRAVLKYLGFFSLATALTFVPSLFWAAWFREYATGYAFLQSILLVTALGGLLVLLGRRTDQRLYQRETLALVGVGWLLTALYGAFPFVLSGELSFVDAYFESMSGYTTTGASILRDIEALPKSLLFWRSFTQWLGGMGIIVLLLAVLPFLGAGGKLLFRSEVPGPDKYGLRPRIKDTAQILARIYFGFTLVQTVLLMIAGMNLFDALCHTFTTLSTGGYSPKNASIAAYDSFAVEAIIILFMVLSATNFNLHYALISGRRREFFRNSEWRLFMGILVISTLLITLNLCGVQGRIPAEVPTDATSPATEIGPFQALRMAAFQVVSIMTTTGFFTEDFNLWPQFSRSLLVLLMLVGGCAGSTGGGIKVVRILMLVKMVFLQIEHTFRPKTVKVLRINNTVVDENTQRSVLLFLALYILIFAMGVVAMCALGMSSETALSSVAATLNNVGPGLELVGAVGNYGFIPGAGKLLLSLLMVLGRLEFYAICVLFVPVFWRRD